MEMFTKVQHHKKWKICLTFSTQRHKNDLFICGIFIKLLHIANTSITKNHHFVKQLAFGMKSYRLV